MCVTFTKISAINVNDSSVSVKEDVHMIDTGKYKMFGQLEEQAEAGDVEAFVFRNGEVVPANQAENATGPVIHTAREKNYGQMEDIANGNSDIDAFVYQGGNIVPADQAQNSTGTVIHTAQEKNFAVNEAGVISE